MFTSKAFWIKFYKKTDTIKSEQIFWFYQVIYFKSHFMGHWSSSIPKYQTCAAAEKGDQIVPKALRVLLPSLNFMPRHNPEFICICLSLVLVHCTINEWGDLNPQCHFCNVHWRPTYFILLSFLPRNFHPLNFIKSHRVKDLLTAFSGWNNPLWVGLTVL